MHQRIALHPAPLKGIMPPTCRMHVGTNTSADAFGNALGNSIVGHLSQRPTVSVEEQANLETFGAALLADNTAKLNKNLNSSTNKVVNDAVQKATDIAADQAAENLTGLVATRRAQQDASYEASALASINRDTARISSSLAHANTVYQGVSNLVSTAYENRQTAAISRSQLNAARAARYERGAIAADNTFAAIGASGVDVNASFTAKTAGYTEFRQNRQAKFDQFYGDLNSFERFAFDNGVDFSEFVLETYEAVGNGVEVGIEAGKMVANGADVRLAVGFKNSENFEVKAFAGTDIAGVSHKGRLFENKIASNSNLLQPLKTNVATRFVVDTFGTDGFNPRLDFVQEFDSFKLDTSGLSRRVGFIDSEATFGLRRNLTTLENRASLNIKFELPDAVERFTFGWTPTVSLEFRSK
ncbi:hypothetical protein [Agaribacter flavus]|uniref:Uncharacterized protein n=1 Tax=Agaribacter flavus TaxID=1902781 RepID=A0ABV7FIB2_9ALTE